MSTRSSNTWALAGVIAVMTAVAFGGGFWLADRDDDDPEPTLDASGTTAPTSSSPVPTETVLIVTLPSTTTTVPASTTTTAVAPTTSLAPAPTSTQPPVSYQTAREQVEHYTIGPERDRVISELAGLTPHMISVDQLDARHSDEIAFEISPDSAPRALGPTVIVSLTSEFGGPTAAAEEAWIVAKYFSSLWAMGEPVRAEIAGEPTDDLLVENGYGLEVNIGRYTYVSTGPTMAAIADVNLGFADWERLAAR